MTADLLMVELDAEHARGAWARLLSELAVPEQAFGAECWIERPRPTERFWLALDPSRLPPSEHHACADVDAAAIGLVYTLAPAPVTRAFGLGLYRMARGRGLGPVLRDAALALCFADSAVHTAETEILDGNTPSLVGLHRRHGRMREVGRRADRLLLAITRDEWASVEANR